MPTTGGLALRTNRPVPPARTARSPGDLRITVGQEQDTWQVSGSGFHPMMFATGAAAERAARRLAACLASRGDDVRLEIHDRGGALVAHIRVFADNPAAEVAASAPRPLHA